MIPDKFLPLGSVVLLKNAKKSIMIMGYGFTGEVDNSVKVFDYSACLYPEGFLDPNKSILFDHESIEKVEFLGFDDDRSKEWRKFFVDNLDDIKKQVAGGKSVDEIDVVNSEDKPNLSTYITVDELNKQKAEEASDVKPPLSTYVTVDELAKQKAEEAGDVKPPLSTYVTVDELAKQKAEEASDAKPPLSTYITVDELNKQKAIEEGGISGPDLSTYITVEELERQKAEDAASNGQPPLSTYITVDELNKQKAQEAAEIL